ncbi:hypothetical protein ACQY0O_001654 [Thecaphora frezii]
MSIDPSPTFGMGQNDFLAMSRPSVDQEQHVVPQHAHLPPSASIIEVSPSTGLDDSLEATDPPIASPKDVVAQAPPSQPIDDEQNHCRFVLLAEFDIDKGSTLSHQYPAPTGYDEHMLAELMLPDGTHARVEDWTVFFLKPIKAGETSQTQASSSRQSYRASVDSMQKNDPVRRPDADWSSNGLTYVINLVRTKHDNSVRRGALVKSLAIGTRHPYIDIFKPVLLLALDDYFKHPGVDCLARLHDAINQLDLSAAPVFSRAEKLILRASDRRDFFEEKFINDEDRDGEAARSTEEAAPPPTPSEAEKPRARADSGSTVSEEVKSLKKKHSAASLLPVNLGARRGSSAVSMADRRPSQPSPLPARAKPRDTHFYDTTLGYRQILLPIRVPLTTFPEEVGEYSLIKLIQTFSGPQSTPHGPLHPHLHSNGSMTHPIILLFNALITQKRVVFLGHGQPANLVASYVLAACALGSGCGAVFRGFASRAFPYTNLMNLDELEKVPGYIAGVTNPRFEDLHAWDVLLNVETGKILVSKDLPLPPPVPTVQRPQMTRDTFSSNSISSMAGNTSLGYESSSKTSSEFDPAQFGALPTPPPIKTGPSGRDRSGTVYDSRVDSPNNLFMDDILSAIQAHYGERYIRSRITDFVMAFAKSVSRHEEHVYGFTKLGPTSQPFLNGQLGSGPVFPDRDAEIREIQANQVRVEGFRASIPFRLFLQDEQEAQQSPPLLPFDLSHQIARLKRARQLSPGESELIFSTIAQTIVTHDQITELLSLLPSHAGGLLPLGFGLFHPKPTVRTLMVDLFLRLCATPIGKKFVQSLNTYHRLAFARLASERLEKLGKAKEEAGGEEDGGGITEMDAAEAEAVGGAGSGKPPRPPPLQPPMQTQTQIQQQPSVQSVDHPFRVFTPTKDEHSPGPAHTQIQTEQ